MRNVQPQAETSQLGRNRREFAITPSHHLHVTPLLRCEIGLINPNGEVKALEDCAQSDESG